MTDIPKAPKLMPCLWFDTNLEEAFDFYVSLFPNARILERTYYGEAGPMPAGTVMTMVCDLDGQLLLGLNGGPYFKPNEAVSIAVQCDSQEEIDRLWAALTADGGEEGQCGWLKDRFGFSWQIAPRVTIDRLRSGDRAGVDRMFQAMFPMRKLDLAALEAAYAG